MNTLEDPGPRISNLRRHVSTAQTTLHPAYSRGNLEHSLESNGGPQPCNDHLCVGGLTKEVRLNDVEVTDRQQIGLARRQPGAGSRALAPGAMPVAAGVIGDPPVPAVVAGLDMTAQRGGAAGLDRRHDLELTKAEMPGMSGAIGGPGAAEDIGDLE